MAWDEISQSILIWLYLFIVYQYFPRVTSHPSQEPGSYTLKTVDQCYGHQIPIICPKGSLVQIDKAYYRQASYCPGDFHSNFCSKQETSNPACIGNQTCIFTTPWVYLSKECGYSNNFMVNYFCIPDVAVHDICQERIVRATTGYISSPNYPAKYPTSLNCAIQILAPRGYKLTIHQLDLYLSYYNYNSRNRCIDRLWITDGATSTGYLCSSQKRSQVFSTRGNKALIKFITSPHFFKHAKGFWLYFEATPITTSTSVNDKSNAVTLKPVTTNTSDILPHPTITTTEKPTGYSPETIQVLHTILTPTQKTLTDEQQSEVSESKSEDAHQRTTKQKEQLNHKRYGTKTKMFPRNYFAFRRFHSKETMPKKPLRSNFYRRKNWQKWLRQPRWKSSKRFNLPRRRNSTEEIVVHSPKQNMMDGNQLEKKYPKILQETVTEQKLHTNDTTESLNSTTSIFNLSTTEQPQETTSNIGTEYPTKNLNTKTVNITSTHAIPVETIQYLSSTEWPSMKNLFLKNDPKMYGPPSIPNKVYLDYNFDKWFFKHLFGVDLPYLKSSVTTILNRTNSTKSRHSNITKNIVSDTTQHTKGLHMVSVSEPNYQLKSTANQLTNITTGSKMDTAQNTAVTDVDTSTLTSSISTSTEYTLGIHTTEVGYKDVQNGAKEASFDEGLLLTKLTETTITQVSRNDTPLTTISPLKHEYKQEKHNSDSNQLEPVRDHVTKQEISAKNNHVLDKHRNRYNKPTGFQKETYTLNNNYYKGNYRNRYNYRDRKPSNRNYNGNWMGPNNIPFQRNLQSKDKSHQEIRNTRVTMDRPTPHTIRSSNQTIETGKKVKNKTESNSLNSSPLAQSESHTRISLGTKEFSGIVGGSASLVLLILIAALVTSLYKRCHKSYSNKRKTFANTKRKKKFNNDIILAYESSEGDISPNSLSSISNISFNEDRNFPHLHTTLPYTGNMTPNFDNHGHKRSLLDHMDLLKTIDERPEDIYSHFKFSKTKWLKQKLAKKPRRSPEIHISKSADNLSDLYPSLERRLSCSEMKSNKKGSFKNTKLIPFSKAFTMEKIAKNKSDRSGNPSEVMKLTDSMDDTLDGLPFNVARNFATSNTTCNASQQTSGSLLRRSKSEPDLAMNKGQQQEVSSNSQNSDDENTGPGDGKIMNMSKHLNIQPEDDTLDTDNMSSIIDFTAPNSEMPQDDMHSDITGDGPSTFTHVTEYENPEGHYSSLDDAHKYLWEKRGESPYLYEPVYQQIPDNDVRNVILTSFTNTTSDDTEQDVSETKGHNVYENAKDRETFKCTRNASNGVKPHNLDVKSQEKDYATISYPEDKHRFKKPKGADKHKKKSASQCHHHKSSDNSKYGKTKSKKSKKTKQNNDKEKHNRHPKQTAKSEDDRSSFDSLRKSHEYHKQRKQAYLEATGAVHKDIYNTKPGYSSSSKSKPGQTSLSHQNQHIMDLLEQSGDMSKDTLKKILTNNPDYSHVDLSTMMSQNELTSDSLDLSFYRTQQAKQQIFPTLTHQNIVQMLAQQYTAENTSLSRKNGKKSKAHSSSFQFPSDTRHKDRKPHSGSHKKTSDFGDVTCSPYSTIGTINDGAALQQNQVKQKNRMATKENIAVDSEILQRYAFLPQSPFVSNHFPKTYNAQSNWKMEAPRDADAEKKVSKHNSKYVKGYQPQSTNNLSMPLSDAPGKHFLLCSSEASPEDGSRSAYHSNASSQRSRKSHATLYSDITDIEGIYMPKSVPHSHGDVSL